MTINYTFACRQAFNAWQRMLTARTHQDYLTARNDWQFYRLRAHTIKHHY